MLRWSFLAGLSPDLLWVSFATDALSFSVQLKEQHSPTSFKNNSRETLQISLVLLVNCLAPEHSSSPPLRAALAL